MRSPAAAIAWEFHRPHRWALVALAGYLLVVGIVKLLVFGPAPVSLDPPDAIAALGVVPFTVTFFYLLALFSFGLTGDLAGRQSIFPSRLFTLPVPTTALAGWPMLYGAASMASLWLVAALLARWPWGLDLPFIWPAFLAAAFLAWTQVLAWMPYGVSGLRVIATVLWLIALDAIVILAVHYEASEPLMVAFLAPQLPLAYLAARVAVARARRGDAPDWRGSWARRGRLTGVVPPQREFSSPARAQLWFEWRRHGRTLPVLVGMLLPFELGLLFIPGNETPAVVFKTLAAVLVTPVVMAGFVAATVSTSNPHARDTYGVAPFLATRPSTSAALIAAKLKMAIWSTLATWLLVLVAIVVTLALSGTWPVAIDRVGRFSEAVGTPRVIVVALLGFAWLLTSTWKQLVRSLYIGLTGREWIIKTSGFLALVLLLIMLPTIEWIGETKRVQAALWDAWPLISAVLVAVKMTAAAWIATVLYAHRLLSDRTLLIGAAGWMIAVLALYGVLVWWVSTPFIPRYLLAMIAILAVPLARLSAAPLALDWNRHR
ncbi:MAG: hypothetical protein WD227_07390 [Vicinamibacterales bacterium]